MNCFAAKSMRALLFVEQRSKTKVELNLNKTELRLTKAVSESVLKTGADLQNKTKESKANWRNMRNIHGQCPTLASGRYDDFLSSAFKTFKPTVDQLFWNAPGVS